MLLKSHVLLLSATTFFQVPVFAEEATRSSAKPERKPRIILIVKSGEFASDRELARLRNPGGPFDALISQGWKIGSDPTSHIQIVEADNIPDRLKQWEVTEFPTVLSIEGDEILRSFKEGCSTPLDQYTFGWLLKGVSERPAASPASLVTVPTTGSYQLRGNHWNFEGNWNPGREYMLRHLRANNHVTLYPASWPIDKWSEEELRSLHDDLHEMGRPRLPLDSGLEPGNSVRPGEVVPIYRPAIQTQYANQSSPARSSSQRAGSTSAAAKASKSSGGSSRSSGSGFF